MAKSTTFCNDLMKLLFQATAIANIADNAGASPLANLYLSLHTADPGAGGTQLTNETAYTNYLRVAVARSAGGWTVSSNQASNAALVQFAQCGASGSTITHVAIGTASSGAGKILYSGTLNSQLAVAQLIQPQFSIGALVAQET
jgi:hypothetical protein